MSAEQEVGRHSRRSASELLSRHKLLLRITDGVASDGQKTLGGFNQRSGVRTPVARVNQSPRVERIF